MGSPTRRKRRAEDRFAETPRERGSTVARQTFGGIAEDIQPLDVARRRVRVVDRHSVLGLALCRHRWRVRSVSVPFARVDCISAGWRTAAKTGGVSRRSKEKGESGKEKVAHFLLVPFSFHLSFFLSPFISPPPAPTSAARVLCTATAAGSGGCCPIARSRARSSRQRG